MSSNLAVAAVALLISGAAQAAVSVPLSSPAAAKPHLAIVRPWSRPTPPGAPTAVGYLTIVNTGKGSDRLVGAASPLARAVEVHEMSMAGGVMRMRPVADGVAVPAGGQVVLAPGGYHLMLIGPTRPLKAGDAAPVTLHFKDSGDVKVVLAVGPEPQR